MLSYAIAGALVGGALGFIVDWLDIDAVRQGLRALSAAALVAAALVASARCAIPARGSAGCCGRGSRRSASGFCQ